jgi:hypothetical protein
VPFVEQLHLPHAQLLKLLEVLEERVQRPLAPGGHRLRRGTPVQVDEEAVLQRVDWNVVVRTVQRVSGATRPRYCGCDEVYIVVKAEPEIIDLFVLHRETGSLSRACCNYSMPSNKIASLGL